MDTIFLYDMFHVSLALMIIFQDPSLSIEQFNDQSSQGLENSSTPSTPLTPNITFTLQQDGPLLVINEVITPYI